MNNENICLASEKNKKEIINLWNICFPESPEFTKWYFENMFSAEKVLIYKKNNKITAMLTEIPLQFNNLLKATYIYGVCTLPVFRKKGVMTKLLNQSFINDKKKGVSVSILIPENDELFDFYKKFGYEKASLIKKEYFEYSDFTNMPDNKYIFKRADFSDIENMNKLYESVLKNCKYILRNKEFYKGQINMFGSLDGGCFCLYGEKTRSLSAYAFVWKEPVLKVQEICFIDNDAKNAMCKNLFREFGSEKMELKIYGGQGEYASCIKFHNQEVNNSFFPDYIINLLWN